MRKFTHTLTVFVLLATAGIAAPQVAHAGLGWVAGQTCNTDGTVTATVSWDNHWSTSEMNGGCKYAVMEGGSLSVPYSPGTNYWDLGGSQPNIGCSGQYTFTGLSGSTGYSFFFSLWVGDRWAANYNSTGYPDGVNYFRNYFTTMPCSAAAPPPVTGSMWVGGSGPYGATGGLCAIQPGQSACQIYMSWGVNGSNGNVAINIVGGTAYPTETGYTGFIAPSGTNPPNRPLLGVGSYLFKLYGQDSTGTWQLVDQQNVTVTPPPSPATGTITGGGCTIPYAGGACTVRADWSAANTNQGLVDVFLTDPAGATQRWATGVPATNSVSGPTGQVGTYTVQLFDAGTNNRLSFAYFTVTVNPAPTGTITPSTCTLVAGQTTCQPHFNWSTANTNGVVQVNIVGSAPYTTEDVYCSGIGTAGTDGICKGIPAGSFSFKLYGQNSANQWVLLDAKPVVISSPGVVCPADQPYSETNTANIQAYCNAVNGSPASGMTYPSSMACHAAPGWANYGSSCTAPSCSCVYVPVGASSCTTPWGATVADGGSVTAYLQSVVTSPATCASVSQTRTCSNGTLSGSYLNQSCSVNSMLLPDLTALMSPVTTNVGVATAIAATLANNGNASTGASFTNMLEIGAVNAGNPVQASDIVITRSDVAATLPANTYGVANFSYTFAAPGTYAARVCADLNSINTGLGSIAESNEGNNCSAWTTVVVAAVAATCPAVGTVLGTVAVTGTTDSAVWGSGPYTTDSVVGTAAVHAGLISVGQTATIVKTSAGSLSSFQASTQNGVTTLPYAPSFCAMTLSVQGSPSSCATPWGSSVANGGTVTAYQTSSVTSPATCTSQTRTCTNGTLSGTYANQSCSVGAAADTLATGFLDVADCSVIGGWAVDPDSPNTIDYVDIFDNGSYFATYPADVDRGAGFPAATGIAGLTTANHGYAFTTPTSLKTGTNHTISARAVNLNSSGVSLGTNRELNASPKILNCAGAPAGAFTGVGCKLPTGGGTCNVQLDWKIAFANNGMVDLYQLSGAGTVMNQWLNLPADPTQLIPIGAAGTYQFKLTNNGTQTAVGGPPNPISITVEAADPGVIIGTLPNTTPHTTTTADPIVNLDPNTTYSFAWTCPVGSVSSTGLGGINTGGALSGTITLTTDPTKTSYGVQCNRASGSPVIYTDTVKYPGPTLTAPSRIRKGDTATLTWSASSVTSCTLSGPNLTPVTKTAVGTVIALQTSTAVVNAQSTYTLTCVDQTGTSVSQIRTINLIPQGSEI